jgi:hypothetical protein
MLKKFIALTLVGLLFTLTNSLTAQADANANPERVAKDTQKVKSGVLKLGTGEKARIEVKLKNKTKLAGYVSQAGDERFTITDAKSGAATDVNYADVGQVKGNNLATGVKVAIWVGVAIAAGFLIWYLTTYCHNEGC